MQYNLLIASASAGAGHVRAASALKRAFEAAGHAGSAEAVDVLDHMTPWFRTSYLRSYYSVISRAPSYWRHLYERWDRTPAQGLQRRAIWLWDRLNAGRFIRLIREQQFTHIVCTHFLPAELAAWMRRTGRIEAPVGVIVTDYDAHRIWINEGTDRYFVASGELRELLVSKGAPAGRVVATGIPIDPVFSEPMARAAARAELGLDPELPAVLVVAGAGAGDMERTVAAVAACGPLQILAVTRHDEKLRQALEQLPLPSGVRLVAYGFVDFMHKLMAAADLIVTKPGGMSTTECLARGLPMILTIPIPGQEEKNSAFLVGSGAALPAGTPEDVRTVVGDLLGDRSRLDRMKQAARAAARPRAAFDIIDGILAATA